MGNLPGKSFDIVDLCHCDCAESRTSQRQSRAEAAARHAHEDVCEALYGVRYKLDDDHIIGTPAGPGVLQDLARHERKRAESPSRALRHKRSESPHRGAGGRTPRGSVA